MCKESYKKIVEDVRSRDFYLASEIRNIANDILKVTKYYNGRSCTPIVKIIKDFGISIYKENFEYKIGYKIIEDNNNKEIYKSDKVIIVNKKHHIFLQRFYAACGLAYFLFYDGKNIDECKIKMEIFAREILMPTESFKNQYNIVAKEGKMFVILYLSKFFEVSIENIEKRIEDLC